jgi:hypothetical protein
MRYQGGFTYVPAKSEYVRCLVFQVRGVNAETGLGPTRLSLNYWMTRVVSDEVRFTYMRRTSNAKLDFPAHV